MAVNGETVGLCAGCPMQANFVGDISEETATVEITLPQGMLGVRGKAEFYLSFVDPDGQSSHAVSESVPISTLQDAGVGINETSRGAIRNPKTSQKELEKMLQPVAERTISRIGRCGSVATKDTLDPRPVCPAFQSRIFRDMVRDEIKVHEQQHVAVQDTDSE